MRGFAYFSVLCLLFFVLFSLGCGTEWGKKIARIGQKPPRPAQFNVEASDEREYAVLYKEHYQFWRGWHQELVKTLGLNRKRDRQNMQEARRQLENLEKYLHEDKAKQVREFLERFDRHTRPLLRPLSSSGDADLMKRNLESLQAQIESRLHPKKVKDFFLPTPVPMDMKAYQGDEPILSSPPPASVKPPSLEADSPKDGDELTYEKFRSLSSTP
ncbi:MAG: hypothetical protein HYZ85_01000 [Candidatus Omnitrophica bacterium]|nr:hypothetical protein [Candidatus Omnitrophota bacterium]